MVGADDAFLGPIQTTAATTMRRTAERINQGLSPWARLAGKLLLAFLFGAVLGFLICLSLAQTFTSFSLA
ncbi:MAG: hypothetical protein R3B09_25205 [Nannocystaceae bacterium]